MQNVDIGGSHVWNGVVSVWELFVLSVQFYCDHKTALKKSVLKIQTTTTTNKYGNNFEDLGYQVTEKSVSLEVSNSLEVETN